MTQKQKKKMARIVSAIILLTALNFTQLSGNALLAAYCGIYLIIGGDILLKALKGVCRGDVLDENFLMAIASAGAMALAYCRTNDYTEAVAVLLFYQIGEFFESYAVGKSRKNIKALTDIRPDYANVETDGKLERVAPDSVHAGDEIVVLSGEKVPLDSVVVDGESFVNTSALTGEGVPRAVKSGSCVFASSVNVGGVLRCRVTKEFGESTAAKIFNLIENAAERKSKSENFITKFARIYTPAVCASALALAIVPPLTRFAFDLSPQTQEWIYRALIFLVISCPCALVISIPLSFFAGIGGASRLGILIKGSNYLETLANVKTVVFDKTGTLTKGVFEVCGIHHNEIDAKELLEYAALAESGSTHPIGKSIQKAYGKTIDRSRVKDVREIGGGGIIACIDGKQMAAGSDRLMKELNVECIPCHEAGTVVHTALDGKYAGHIVIADVVKPQAKEAIDALKRIGVKKTVMLTGDLQKVADSVADKLGIDETCAQMMPQDKLEKMEELLKAQPQNEKTAFVGDGINDSPVLTRADVGVAMGALGSDAAIEAADVVLTDDNPKKVADAIFLSRRCLRIVRENIAFALGVKGACLVLGALGLANMWMAVFADVGVMVIAVANAMRALIVKKA